MGFFDNLEIGENYESAVFVPRAALFRGRALWEVSHGKGGPMQLIGNGPKITRLREEISRVAVSNVKVLITGPTGAGKELVAREIHRLSSRCSRPLIIVNCAALTESLLETELFGHTKGSYTGAHRDQKGKLEQAHGGTIFLDEIGDMTLRMQGLILRFLESGEIQPVGDPSSRVVDVRVVTATNADVAEMIAQRTLRKDLYFRLKVAHIEVPPLATHTEDIPELIRHFVRVASNDNGHCPAVFSVDALTALANYRWPGNVRELKNLVETMVLYRGREVVEFKDLPHEIKNPPDEKSDAETLYQRMVVGRESFWEVVYPRFMHRELTKTQVHDIIEMALIECHGHYRQVVLLLNVGSRDGDYKRFLNFLRKHKCLLDFRLYR